MECSIIDKVKTDLRKNNLTNKELEAPLSKERELSRYVINLTNLAKNKYKVDLGNVFSITKSKTNIKLEPNIAAFDAIERSHEYESEQAVENSKNNLLSLDKNKVNEEIYNTEQQLKTQPTIVEPKGLPTLEITC